MEHLNPGKVLAENFGPKKPLTEHLNPKILHFYMNFKVSKNLAEHLGPACGTLGTTGLVVKADGSWPRGCGFKLWHRILEGCKQFASYYIK